MPLIVLKTLIDAPLESCFDLARSIDLHVQSMQQSGEKAIAGKINGLICLNESVTWRAKHFGLYFTMSNKITAMEQPNFFIDEMIKGPFKKLHHQHLFKVLGTQTEMTDIFWFETPFGILGWLANKVLLKSYMKKLLLKRNEMLSRVANFDNSPSNMLKI
ncbi:cell division protein [Pedobacter sp. Leaf216]|uniref:SRPBCC family protein n=1 Tax=Pedobacter sp. Leaf216 TaxID=1735684 RepID=UPI0006F5EED0|nr:SRPBCC family protein [Pedobacter sp. Leaf216]KQM79104.1 cell division protein [Pedobacter sp. Leaf216]